MFTKMSDLKERSFTSGWLSKLNILSFLDDDFMNICFPLHDREQLEGKKLKDQMFAVLKKYKKVYDKVKIEKKKAVFQFENNPEDPKKPKTKIERALNKAGHEAGIVAKEIKKTGEEIKKAGGKILETEEGIRKAVTHSLLQSPVEVEKVEVSLLPPLTDIHKMNLNIDKSELPNDKEIATAALMHDIFGGTMNTARKIAQNSNPLGNRNALAVSLKFIDRNWKFINPELNLSRMINRKFDKKLIDSQMTEEFKSNPGRYSGMYDICAEPYRINNYRLIRFVEVALDTNQPIRNFLPLVFKSGDISNFKTTHELKINYPLTSSFKFSLLKHIKVYPEETMRHYFGEKIALYFGFVAFYRDAMTLPAILGTLLTVVLFVYRGMDTRPSDDNVTYSSDWYIEKIYEWLTVGFSIFLCFWSTRFLVKWDRHEKEFSQRYGQVHDDTSYRETRPTFYGKFCRDMITDKINSLWPNETINHRKMVLIGFIVACYCALTAFSSFELLKAKRDAYTNGQIESAAFDTFFIDGTGLTYNLLEFIRIKGFEWIFFKVIIKLIEWQNLKYIDEHESQLILYLGLYQLFNNAIVIIIISIQSLYATVAEATADGTGTVLKSKICVDGSCTEELNLFFLTYTILQLTWALIVKLVVFPIIEKINKIAVEKVSKLGKSLASSLGMGSKKTKKNTTVEGQGAVDNVQIDEKIVDDLENFIKEMVVDDDNYKTDIEKLITTHFKFPYFFYNKINEEIDHQVTHLKDYKIGDDFDQGLLDYLEIFTMYAYLALFGVLFPFSFFLVAVIAWAEWRMDSKFLFHQTRRPNPAGASTIGLWMDLLKLVSMLTVITNSFFMSFVLFERKSYTWKFSCFLITNIVLSIATTAYLKYRQGLSSSVAIIAERTTFIRDRLFGTNKPKKLSKHPVRLEISNKMFGGSGLGTKDLKNFLSNLAKDADEQFQLEKKQKEENFKFYKAAMESVSIYKARQASTLTQGKHVFSKLEESDIDDAEKLQVGNPKEIPKGLDFGTGFD